MAGRDGFWLDRALRANGIENLVVDSSIEVPRLARRRKTDRLDLFKPGAYCRHFESSGPRISE